MTADEPGATRGRARGSDRRKHPRARMTWKAAVGFEEDRALVPATTRNVSVGGACVASSLDAFPGDYVVVVLSAKDRAMPALGTVVRTDSLADGRRVLHIEFAWLPDPSRDKLQGVTRDPAA